MALRVYATIKNLGLKQNCSAKQKKKRSHQIYFKIQLLAQTTAREKIGILVGAKTKPLRPTFLPYATLYRPFSSPRPNQ
jgi:hypothetical protein